MPLSASIEPIIRCETLLCLNEELLLVSVRLTETFGHFSVISRTIPAIIEKQLASNATICRTAIV